MKISVNGAIVASVLAAISHQASAGEKINIESSKVDHSALEGISLKVIAHGDVFLSENFEKFANSLVNDGESLGIDISVHLASLQDSTDKKGKSLILGCYTNCHSACHGSRSWR